MDAEFIRHRITELRLRRGISEYKMSRDLGHNPSYIQHIVSGKGLPSMTEFLYICDYLEVTPRTFFDESKSEITLIEEAESAIHCLSDDDLKVLLPLLKHMKISADKK
mgnify:CR=1 FL=1